MMIAAFAGAVAFEATALPEWPLEAIAEDLVKRWEEYLRKKGEYAVGPLKFFEQGLYKQPEVATPPPEPPNAFNATGLAMGLCCEHGG